MLSLDKVSQQQEFAPFFEVWLYSRPTGLHMPVQACGLFDTEAEACRFGAAVREWIGERKWSEQFDTLPEEEREDLLRLPDLLTRGLGVDPRMVLVTVAPYPKPGGDNTDAGDTMGEHYRLDAGQRITFELRRDPGDSTWSVRSPELRGINTQGQTIASALEMAADAVRGMGVNNTPPDTDDDDSDDNPDGTDVYTPDVEYKVVDSE